MKTSEKQQAAGPRVLVVRPGEVITQECLDACPHPGSLEASRKARRNAAGQLIATAELRFGVPA